MIHDPAFYAAAFAATVLVGLSKGGFTGLSVLAQPILALVISPIQAAAIMLPVLIVQDAVSVYAYWRRWDGRELRPVLLPACAGVVLGYLLAAFVSDAAVLISIGLLSLGEAGRRLLAARKAGDQPRFGRLGASFWCALAGFTSMIANAGGPPFMIYLLRQGLSRDTFVATGVAFFTIVNWVKVPFFLALGQINGANLATSAVLFPLAVVATLAGVRLVRVVPAERFFGIIYTLLAIVGVKLVYDGLAAQGLLF